MLFVGTLVSRGFFELITTLQLDCVASLQCRTHALSEVGAHKTIAQSRGPYVPMQIDRPTDQLLRDLRWESNTGWCRQAAREEGPFNYGALDELACPGGLLLEPRMRARWTSNCPT